MKILFRRRVKLNCQPAGAERPDAESRVNKIMRLRYLALKFFRGHFLAAIIRVFSPVRAYP